MPNDTGVSLRWNDDIAVITVDRPQRANALDRAAMEELLDITIRLTNAQRPHAAILTGAGERWFISGADTRYLQTLTRDEFRPFADLVVQTYQAIRRLPCPTIASIGGAAVGVGLTMALACDIRVATRNAVFGHPEAKLGFVGGTALLPRFTASTASARGMLFTGRLIAAEQALQLGLLSDIAGSHADLDCIVDGYVRDMLLIDRSCLVAVKSSLLATEQVADPISALATQQATAALTFNPDAVQRAAADARAPAVTATGKP